MNKAENAISVNSENTTAVGLIRCTEKEVNLRPNGAKIEQQFIEIQLKLESIYT